MMGRRSETTGEPFDKLSRASTKVEHVAGVLSILSLALGVAMGIAFALGAHVPTSPNGPLAFAAIVLVATLTWLSFRSHSSE